jgi:hypothetical protein
MAVSCSHSKNEPMSHSECKNVTISLIQSYDTTYNLVVLIKYSLYCTMLGGSLISSEHQLYRVTPLKTPFGLLIPFITIPITCNYIHSQLFLMLLCVYTIIILTRS